MELSPSPGLKCWAVWEPPGNIHLPFAFVYLSFPGQIPPQEFQNIIFLGQFMKHLSTARHLDRQISSPGHFPGLPVQHACRNVSCVVSRPPPPGFWKYKAFWNFEYFSFPRILLYFSPCAVKCFFSVLCSNSYYFLNVLLSFLSIWLCRPFYTFSLSSLLCVYCRWNTQMFFLVLLTCVTGPQRPPLGTDAWQTRLRLRSQTDFCSDSTCDRSLSASAASLVKLGWEPTWVPHHSCAN